MIKRVFVRTINNLLIISLFLSSLKAGAQVGPDRSTLISPVDIPLFLAGNFGEPRSNHFHSGIDIKTNGVTGIPVKSVADGYISRIKVEPGGYGNALYIRHPNGYTSLYGHLLSFSEEIRKFVISEQYRRESFAVDLFPESSRLMVRKGQVIALSGNSGSSEGPHLHFEFRETQSENPVNPLVRSIAIRDEIPPVIQRLHIYSLKEKRGWTRPVVAELAKSGGTYNTSGPGPVPFDQVSGIGIETFDLLNGSDNRCGVYKILGYLDNELFFESVLDEFSFAETRYMNSFMDYKAYVTSRRTILKLFIDPNNQATVYRFARNRGIIELKGSQVHDIRILVTDVAGNQSEVMFKAKLDPAKFKRDPDFLPVYNAYFNYEEPNSFRTDDFEITLPAGALYDDLYFDYSMTASLPGSFSPVHEIHQREVPVHLYFRLAIEAVNIPDHLRSKAAIVQLTGNNKFSCLGGSWEGDRLVTRTRSFGSYCIRVDTLKPTITPLNFSSSAELKSLNTFRFEIKDDFSGIQTYRGEIDGKWILLVYDPKNSSLTYQYDSGRITGGIQHKLVLRVSDQLANTATYTTSFFR